MKVGTYVEHIQWGKGIIIEELFHINGGGSPCCFGSLEQSRTMKNAYKMTTLKVYEKNLTIISGVE